MPHFAWIQLAGLGRISDDRWPSFREALVEDFVHLRKYARPQMLICLGPLTPDGSSADFATLSRRLAELADARAFADEPPAVLALPGGDDLARVPDDDLHRVALSQWHACRELADTWFWRDGSPYLAAARGWLAEYSRWSETCPIGHPGTWQRRPGLVPGDAAWRRSFGHLSVGLLALDTAFLHPAVPDRCGVIHPRQFHAPCDGDAPAWIAGCDVTLLVTTHPTNAMHPASLAALQELAPPDRIAAHLCGPGDDSRSESLNGAPLRHIFSAAPLDSSGGGYLLGMVDLDGPPTLRVWPRSLRIDDRGPRCTADVGRWDLDDRDGGTRPVLLPARRKDPSPQVAPNLRQTLSERGVSVDPGALVLGALTADGETLEALTVLPALRDAPLCITGVPALELLPPTPGLPGTGRWIVGGSIAELSDKLSAANLPILMWDGTPLPSNALIPRRLRPCPPKPATSTSDPLWTALVSAARGTALERSRGVLVVAAPGAGKTVWSQMLARSFRDSAYGALGGAVWRSARELAETIRSMPGQAWHEWLSRREPTRAAAFAALERTRRLVVVVDGLDELTTADLAQIEAALRRVPGIWIATRRPGESVSAGIEPELARLELVELSTEDRHRLLESLGRSDLVRDISYRPSRTRLLGEDTPLLIALTARIVQSGEDPDAVPQDVLYRRFFETLLVQAQRDRRLSVEGSRLLRLLVGSVVGTLALLWLQEGARPLDATRIEVVLESEGLPPHQRIAALEALEFGYLLRPIEGGWEFAHRTLAEWAAAAALHRRVKRIQLRDPSAAAEREVLAPFLAAPGPRHYGRWSQLLRFYAPHVRDPVGLLTALLGPDSAAHWRRPYDAETKPARIPEEYEVHNGFSNDLSFAVELLTRCHWGTPDAARRSWALVARAWLLLAQPGMVPEIPRAFLDGIAPHLPHTLAGLIDLFAVDDAARVRLADDPTALLPVLPAECSEVLAEYLTTATADHQYRIVQWANRNEASLPSHWLLTVSDDSNLESEAWLALVRLGEEPPWAALKRCAESWPYHLEKALLAWFARPPRERFSAETIDRRKVVLGIVLERSTSGRAQLDEVLRDPDLLHLAQVAACVLSNFADRDAHAPERLLRSLLRERGLEGISRRPSAIPEADVRALEERVYAAERAHDHLCKLLKALDRSSLDAVAGGLWRSLPPDAPARQRLVAAFKDTRQWPAAVDLAAVLATYERYDHLRGALAPQHVAALRERVDEQTGAARYAAVLQLADAEGVDSVSALLRAFRPGDAAYEAAMLEHLEHHSPPTETVVLADDLLGRLPLKYQAALGAAGWRKRLLAALANEPIREEWVQLATEHFVTEAIEPLIARLEQLPVGAPAWNIPLATWLSAVAALCPVDEQALGARAVHAALSHAASRTGWIRDHQALATFLALEDVPLVLAVEPAALQRPELRARLRALGPPAFELLLASFRAATNATSRSVLRDLLLAIADPMHIPLSLVIELCAELRADRYSVSSSPGPLGAEFDEPEDQIWRVEQDNAPTFHLLGNLLTACMRARPGAWRALEPLLVHPSALVRSQAFANILAHAPWDPNRTMDMLASVLGAPPATIEGDPRAIPLLASGRAEQVGELRDAWTETLRHLELFLSFQHEAFLVLLTHSEAPQLRAKGAEWIGKLGTSEWCPHVVPLLAERSPGVVAVALRAILRLDRTQAPAAIAAASRAAWTHRHYFAVLARAVRGPSPLERYRGASADERLELPPALAFTLLDEAVAAQAGAQGDHRPTVFGEFPSACEELLSRIGAFDAPRFERWSTAASVAVRAVARRLLATERALDPAALVPLLNADDPAERLSAAECLTRMNCTAHFEPIAAAWRASQDQRNDYQLPAEVREGLWQLDHRFLWALQGEPAAVWVSLLDLALRHLPQDSEDMTLTSEGEFLVDQGCRILQILDTPGVCEFVRGMEDRRIESDPSFEKCIVSRVRADASLLADLQRLADTGNAIAQGILGDVSRSPIDPRKVLADQLRQHVFAEAHLLSLECSC